MKRVIVTLLLLVAPSLTHAGEGEEIFSSVCTACHQRPEPQMLTAKQWDYVLGVMQQRMAQKNMEPLTPEERTAVFEYLKERAKQ